MVKRLASASVLVVLVFAAASGANAFTSDKRTYFTFNQPVALPGVTLPAGTYMFRIADPQESRKVIQVADKKGTTSYALLHTMPAYRADAPKDSEIRFRETAAGAPPAVGVWWYMGERNGYEFIYTKEQLAALNKSAQPAPAVAESNAAVESPEVPPIQDASKSPDVVDGAGVPPVEERAEPEAQIAQAQPEQPAVPAQPTSPAPESRSEARERLPQTASPLALLLLSGIATAGFGVKLLRKS
jgi:hypothetical protein